MNATPKTSKEQRKAANRCARQYGTSWATKITIATAPDARRRLAGHRDDQAAASWQVLPRVTHYKGYHAESRTGIRASMAALKRFWSTYHYVPMECYVTVADRDAIYSDDNH